MASFENDVVVAKNLNFDQSAAKPHLGVINAAGKLPIGTGQIAPTPEILGGSLTSPDSSITFGYASPNITAVANSSGGLVHTLTGNSGIATASAGNINVITANSTPKFVGSGSTLTLDFSLSNLILGSPGSAITSGTSNVGVGQSAFTSITSGNRNIAIGASSSQNMTTSTNNVAIGTSTLTTAVNTSDNVAIGNSALASLTTGGSNISIGSNALGTINTGANNVGIGPGTGNAYNGAESSNILISNTGVNAESNTIRIGTNGSSTGQQNRAFLAGVTGVTVAASSPVGVNTNGQLSDLGFGTATQVLTSNGPGVSPSWQASGGGGSSVILVTSPSIDFKTVATTTIFTPTVGMRFITLSLCVVYDTAVSVNGDSVVTMGNNVASYDNWSNGIADPSNVTTQNFIIQPTNSPLPNFTSILPPVINVQVGDTGTTALGKVYLTGYYIT